MNFILFNNWAADLQILFTDSICKDSQSQSIQTDSNFRLKVATESTIALWYQENDHITLSEHTFDKLKNCRTVYIYDTKDSQPHDSLLTIHKIWNITDDEDDECNRLLKTQNFDDNRCYQINSDAISEKQQVQYSHVFNKIMNINL